MKIFDCKCADCQAEFQAVLESDSDKAKCPACDSGNVSMSEAELQPGCGGSCSGCGGGCGE